MVGFVSTYRLRRPPADLPPLRILPAHASILGGKKQRNIGPTGSIICHKVQHNVLCSFQVSE